MIKLGGHQDQGKRKEQQDSFGFLDSKNKESSIKDSISILKKASGKNPFIPWVESEFAKASYLEHEKDLDLTAKFLGISLERLDEILEKN